MKQQHYLGMRPGDLEDKPYAKYWQPEMAHLSEAASHAILEGPVAAELGLAHEEAGRLLEPGYLPLETGYTRLRNGQVFVAVLTQMPGVTGAMIDWWFGWHGGESQRYKLWHPRAHVNVENRDPLSDRRDLGDREKYVGNVSFVHEYIGNEYLPIAIAFNRPRDNYLDEDRFEESGVSTAVCARVGFQDKPINFSRLVHLIRATDEGCEMRSRFWLGGLALKNFDEGGFLNRMLGSPVVARRGASMDLGRDLIVHCAMEMQHLAGFLPALYADYHPGADAEAAGTSTDPENNSALRSVP